MLPASTYILIVGAGPTGLALALALARAGVDFVLLDELAQGQNTSRAAVIHAHTLDVLDGIGAAAPLVAQGLKIAKFAIRDRDRALIAMRFDGLPTRHPTLLMLPQDRIGPLQRVAITVVDRDCDEAARKIALDQPAMHLVEADEIDIAAAQVAQHVVEKLRRDLKQPVRLKQLGSWRPHMMQRHDRANA